MAVPLSCTLSASGTVKTVPYSALMEEYKTVPYSALTQEYMEK